MFEVDNLTVVHVFQSFMDMQWEWTCCTASVQDVLCISRCVAKRECCLAHN